MDTFDHEHLTDLVSSDETATVSIYLPMYRAGREVRQNATRFKNAIKSAEEQIGRRFPENQPLHAQLKQAAELERDEQWWQHQADGLALFLTPERFDRYRLPMSFDGLVTAGERFYVRPMIQLLQGDGKFFVLAVSQNRVRLLKGSRHRMEELNLEELPSDLRSALNIDEYTETLQHHSTGKPSTSGTTLFHGQGGSDMDVQKQKEIQQFFHQIASALETYFGDEPGPLVFAGVEYLYPMFRDTAKLNRLVDKPVTGNPDELSVDDLRTQAWSVVEPNFATKQQKAAERLHDQTGSEKTTSEISEIIQAARQGAVETLLLTDGELRWGVVNEETAEIKMSDASGAQAEELLNYAAVQTLATGGTVYSVPHGDLEENPAAAMLRFPVPS